MNEFPFVDGTVAVLVELVIQALHDCLGGSVVDVLIVLGH